MNEVDNNYIAYEGQIPEELLTQANQAGELQPLPPQTISIFQWSHPSGAFFAAAAPTADQARQALMESPRTAEFLLADEYRTLLLGPPDQSWPCGVGWVFMMQPSEQGY